MLIVVLRWLRRGIIWRFWGIKGIKCLFSQYDDGINANSVSIMTELTFFCVDIKNIARG